jgi:hypothetical protein
LLIYLAPFVVSLQSLVTRDERLLPVCVPEGERTESRLGHDRAFRIECT